jgi:hypothetical protein
MKTIDALISLIEMRNSKYKTESLNLGYSVRIEELSKSKTLIISGFEAAKIMCSMSLMIEPMLGYIRPIQQDLVEITITK